MSTNTGQHNGYQSPLEEDLAALYHCARKYPGEAVVAIVLCIILGVLIREALDNYGHYLRAFVEEYPESFMGMVIALGFLTWLLWQKIVYAFKFARAYFMAARVNIWLRVSGVDSDEMLEMLEPTEIKEKEPQKKVPSLEERKVACTGTGVTPASSKKNCGSIRKRK